MEGDEIRWYVNQSMCLKSSPNCRCQCVIEDQRALKRECSRHTRMAVHIPTFLLLLRSQMKSGSSMKDQAPAKLKMASETGCCCTHRWGLSSELTLKTDWRSKAVQPTSHRYLCRAEPLTSWQLLTVDSLQRTRDG